MSSFSHHNSSSVPYDIHDGGGLYRSGSWNANEDTINYCSLIVDSRGFDAGVPE